MASPTTTTAASPSPALPPPPGVTSNFENPESLKWAMNVAMAVAIPLATIFFVLRAYVRIWIKRQWSAEDWLALIAYIGTVSFCGTGTATMDHNGGKHAWDITPAQAKEAGYWFNVASIHYGITICMVKLAILFLYRRAFSAHRGSSFDITCLFLIVLMILFYIATNVTKIWECLPREKIWDQSIPGKCINIPMLLNVSGIFNTVTDFIMVVLPLHAVWNMNMSRKKKTVVVLAFTFGLCAPIFSLVGTIVRFRGANNPDKTWVQPEIIMWGLAECTTGILCFCFPEMGVLRKKKTWSRKGGASTSIREGRYRLEDAAYKGPSNKFKSGATGGTSFGTMMSVTKTDADTTHHELDEMKLIHAQRNDEPERPPSARAKAESTDSAYYH